MRPRSRLAAPPPAAHGRARLLFASTFRSLQVRNYRLFFFGQLVSVSGTWVQTIAQGWLVLRLTDDNALFLGIVTALQYLPLLAAGTWAGAVADRADKRRLLMLVQVALAAAAAGLGIATLTGVATLEIVFLLVFVTGLATAFDIPARQAFVIEMVPVHYVSNAVGLNSAVFNASRIVGPALAGFMILTIGTGWCFLVNAASYGASIVALAAMRPRDLTPAPPAARTRRQVRAGLRYIASTPSLWSNLALTCVVSVFALNFPVVLPVLAKSTFNGDAGTYSAMTAAMGVGALAGALGAAARQRPTERTLAIASIGFGLTLTAVAFAPVLHVLLAGLVVVGVMNMQLLSTANALVHTEAAPEMRGRVHAVRAIAVVGTTPIGSPIAGVITEFGGARWGLGVGGVTTLVAALAYAVVRRRPNGPSARDSLVGLDGSVASRRMEQQPGPMST